MVEHIPEPVQKFLFWAVDNPPPQPYSVPMGGDFGVLGTFVFIVMAGACVGSFLSVVIWRLPRANDIILKPSHCPKCRKRIPFFLNIPILGWCASLGKCWRCRTPIPFRYPALEMLCCVLITLTWVRAGVYGVSLPLALFWLYITSMLVSVTYIDLDHSIIPDEINAFTAIAALFVGFMWPVDRLGGTGEFNLALAETHVITAAVAKLFSDAIPAFLTNARAFVGLDMFLGLVFGGGFLWLLGEIGKLAFGKRRVKVSTPERLTLRADGFVEGPDEEVVSWDELFERENDQLVVHGVMHAFQPAPYLDGKPVSVITDWKQVSIGNESWPLDELEDLEVDATSWVVPREAMGMGDVKLLAALGLCLGPGGMLFTLTLGSLLGAVFGTLVRTVKLFLKKNDDHGMIPFGPYLAAAAFVYLVAGDIVLRAYARLIMMAAGEPGI
jgi:leader peptidase (prepilin peptidase)/N-methyltransferase